jgi:hypothetical protein
MGACHPNAAPTQRARVWAQARQVNQNRKQWHAGTAGAKAPPVQITQRHWHASYKVDGVVWAAPGAAQGQNGWTRAKDWARVAGGWGKGWGGREPPVFCTLPSPTAPLHTRKKRRPAPSPAPHPCPTYICANARGPARVGAAGCGVWPPDRHRGGGSTWTPTVGTGATPYPRHGFHPPPPPPHTHTHTHTRAHPGTALTRQMVVPPGCGCGGVQRSTVHRGHHAPYCAQLCMDTNGRVGYGHQTPVLSPLPSTPLPTTPPQQPTTCCRRCLPADSAAQAPEAGHAAPQPGTASPARLTAWTPRRH